MKYKSKRDAHQKQFYVENKGPWASDFEITHC